MSSPCLDLALPINVESCYKRLVSTKHALLTSTLLNQTQVSMSDIEVWCGSKIIHKKDTCLEKIGLCRQLISTTSDSIVNTTRGHRYTYQDENFPIGVGQLLVQVWAWYDCTTPTYLKICYIEELWDWLVKHVVAIITWLSPCCGLSIFTSVNLFIKDRYWYLLHTKTIIKYS